MDFIKTTKNGDLISLTVEFTWEEYQIAIFAAIKDKFPEQTKELQGMKATQSKVLYHIPIPTLEDYSPKGVNISFVWE